MRYEYETGPDRNSGTGRLPSDYQEVSVQMMTPAAWERTLVLARRDGLGEAEMAGLAIGCPVHGNASMDFDADGVFCSRCDIAGAAARKDSAGFPLVTGVTESVARDGCWL